jgi:formylglycine-generating enzyme required for sulfatase activity
MAGNVWEWTRSIAGRYVRDTFEWTRYPYQPGDWREDLQRGDEWLRVLRGGAFGFDERFARCASRVRYYPDYRLVNSGFRVVVSPF